MAAESSLRVATTTLCNLNGSQRRPTPLSPLRFMGFRPRPSHSLTSSSLSHFFGSTRINSNTHFPRQHAPRRPFSVFAMAADGIYLLFSNNLFYFFLTSFLHRDYSNVLKWTLILEGNRNECYWHTSFSTVSGFRLVWFNSVSCLIFVLSLNFGFSCDITEKTIICLFN